MSSTQPADNPVSDYGQSLQDSGIYVFMGPVDEESVRPVIEWILYANHIEKKKKKELLLMICSEGGELSPAFALIDCMFASSIPVKTVGLGQISSSGLLIFLAGAPGRRVLTPNTSILSHQFSWGTEGKAHELFAVMREFELTQERMLNHYRITTRLSDEDIRRYLLPPQDVWLSAAEALNHNICDYISDLKQK